MSVSVEQTFASAQFAKMQATDTDLKPVVRAALSDWDASRQWYRPIVEYAAGVYEDLSGYPAPSSFTDRLGDVLAKTKHPDETHGDSVERVTEWVSTFLINAAEYHSGASGDQKQWITMHDDRVRAAHRELDGRTIPSSEKFQVGGVKLRYPGEPVGEPAVWINCRCILRMLKGTEMTLTADVGPHRDAENFPPDDADVEAENPDEAKIDDDTEVPFHGVAAPTDKPTGDRRQLAREGFNVRPLPLTLFYQRAQGEGHGGSTGVGRLTRVEVNPETGNVEYDGFFNFTPEAGEVIQGVSEGWLKGVSVDLDDVQVDYALSAPVLAEDATEAEVMDAIQNQVTTFKSWRIAGLTVVGIPAFHEAYIALGPRQVPHEEDGDGIHDGETQDALAASATEFAPGTHDGPGWITHPVPTGRIRRYWTHGVGAGKIKWGVAGDFNRCRTQLAKYIANPEWLAGACANMHKEATGVWPGRENGQHSAERESLVAAGAKMADAFNLVASADLSVLPSSDYFQDPLLAAATPITIEGDRVFGHIATWGTCHIGFGGTCTEAPHSNTNYSWFRLGAVETTSGIVPVGQITLGTGHAGLNDSATAAAAHYDNTGTAVADIAAGEDSIGIWFSGRLRPGITEQQRAELLGAKLSGDWRRIQGSLELVAALAVNTPGFGIPRLALAASGMQETALVAAGIVEEPVVVEADLADKSVREMIREEMVRMARVQALRARTAGYNSLVRQRRIDAIRGRSEK